MAISINKNYEIGFLRKAKAEWCLEKYNDSIISY